MAITANEVATVRMMREGGGGYRIPADSGIGGLFKPFAHGQRGGRIATLETLYDYFINNVPDPDTAIAQDPDFDEKIRQQPDVHSCMRLRELTVASLPRSFKPSSAKGINPDAAQVVADYCEDVFKGMPNCVDLYRQMQNAVLMGGQGFEFIWVKVDGAERPVEFYPVDKSRFVFDRLGNMAILTREYPVWGAYVEANPVRYSSEEYAVTAPQGKFMYHKYMSEGGSWSRPANEGYLYWGRGEDTRLYLPVTFDHFVLRFRMKWLEKHGMPLSILYYPSSDEAPTQEIMRIAESIREESVVAIPRPPGIGTEKSFYNLEFVEPPSLGYDAFAQFSNEWTKPHVEKILLGGANLLEVGDTGSYGATVDQRDAGSQIIFRYDAQNINETINRQLVPVICQKKWPGLPRKYYPAHNLAPDEKTERLERLEALTQALQFVPIRKEDLYEAAGTTRPKEGEDVVEPQSGEQEPGLFDAFPSMKPKKRTPIGQSKGNGRAQPAASIKRISR